jgi:hypothetical protein
MEIIDNGTAFFASCAIARLQCVALTTLDRDCKADHRARPTERLGNLL